MGSGLTVPSVLDEAAVKELTGLYWDANQFNSIKSPDGTITKEQFLEIVEAVRGRFQKKYCEITEAFTKDIWQPLLMSSFYDILYNSGGGHIYHMTAHYWFYVLCIIFRRV